jgi:hypothetical protein
MPKIGHAPILFNPVKMVLLILINKLLSPDNTPELPFG